MPSTFLGLNTSYTGLVAANAGLNTTANNIANIETTGYSRQAVNQQAAAAMRVFQGYGCVGAGVDTLGAERIRDIYYDEKYWNNNSKLGEADKKQYYAAIIEDYLRDQRGTNQVKGFEQIFSEYQAALSSLATNTGEVNYALAFIGSAGNLCEYFNIMYNSFQKMQTDVNDEVEIKTNEINSIAQEITTLNKEINIIEAGGNAVANELRDKRDLLIDQLSAVIDVECEENPIYDDAGNDTGMNNYVVSIAGGQLLVEGYRYRQLECVPREKWQKVNQNDVDGLYDICWTDTGEEMGVYAKSVRGELKGLIEMRDGNNKEAFHGTISNVNSIENTVTVQVTEDYLKDMSKSTLPLADGRIMLSGEYYYYDSFEYKQLDNGECYYTFKISDNLARNPAKVSKEVIGQNAKVGERVDYQGIPYYLEQMNEWVRHYASAFNGIYGQEGATDYNENDRTGEIFFTGDNAVTGDQYKLDVALGSNRYSSTDDGYFALTAANFNVRKTLEHDASTMITHTIETDGVSKYDILSELKDLSTNLDKMKFRGCSAESFLVCLLGDAGLNASSANNFQELYMSIDESIQNSRFSISGVDTDEEAANMVKYQNAFNLASKMISVLNDCYERLILETGV